MTSAVACILLQFLIYTVTSTLGQVTSRVCEEMEEFRSCGPSCPYRCDTLGTNMCCDLKCVSGCFCKDGFVLQRERGRTKCVSIDECPKPGVVEFDTTSVFVAESAKLVRIAVVRKEGTAGEVTVRWRTREGSARNNTDFEPSTGTLVFPAGVTKRFIEIPIIDNQVKEPSKNFFVELFNASDDQRIGGRSLTHTTVVTVTIRGDEVNPGTVEMETLTISVPENARAVNVTVIRVGGSDGTLTVKWRTLNGTALDGSDFVSASGILVFNDGETRKIISIDLVNDNVGEIAESFKIQLFDPSTETTGFRSLGSRTVVTVTILDDDLNPGSIQMESSNITVLENAGTVSVAVVRSGGSDGVIRVQYRTIDLTAIAGSDYVPAVGQLVFKDGETRKIIPITILDDKIRESTEVFQVQLGAITSDAPGFFNRGTVLATTVAIIDDDTRIGFVEMESATLSVQEDVGIAEVVVIRRGGTDGILRVRWTTEDGTARSGTDYIPSNGELVFNDGESRKVIPVTVLDNSVPEPDRDFRVRLIPPTSVEVPTFRNLGTLLTTTVTIVDNDRKQGYAVVERESLTVNENVGQAVINVLRLDGSNGVLRVQYRTRDGTARAGEDYIRTFGELEFQDGETRKAIRVNIIDDDIREANETFRVQLFNATEENVVRDRTMIVVTIVDNDNLPGYAEMAQSSIRVPEDIGTVQLTVVRLGGSDGTLKVRWRTVDGTATAGEDYVAGRGELIFLDGETRKTIAVAIIDDDKREPDETFRVELTEMTSEASVTGRSHQARTVTVVTIVDNDMKPGFLEMESANIETLESSGNAEIPVIRIGGSDGILTVRYRTVSDTATPGEDFTAVDGELVFPEGITRRIISVPIMDGNRSKPDRSFRIIIFNPMLDGTRPGRLGQRTTARITIKDKDRNPGVIEFLRSNVGHSEGDPKLLLYVIRRRGSDGLVTVRWRTRDGTAVRGSDFNADPGVITFPDGVVRRTIQIDIIDDNIKEEDENFTVEIFDPTGGATLGLNSMITVTILDNDADPCSIQFRRRSSSVRENAGRTRIPVTRRCPDTSSMVSVFFKTEDRSAKAGLDYQSTRGTLIFNPGETDKFIVVPIIDDDIEEPNELFNVILSDPSPGAVVGVPSVHTVTIIDDDDAPQQIQITFRMTTVRIRENIGVVRLNVRRSSAGTGPVTCRIRTVDGTARAGIDFQPLQTNFVTFDRGMIERFIELPIIDNRIQEPDKSFRVELFSPSGGATIPSGLGVVTITILDDDVGYVMGRGRGEGGPDELEDETQPREVPDLITSCPDGLELKMCAHSCPKDCDNMFLPNPCAHKGCLRGCHCPEGFVLEHVNSTKCIRPSECSNSCPGNMVRMSCKLACSPSCQTPSCSSGSTSLLDLPSESCEPGCSCPYPLVLESPDSNNCVEVGLCTSRDPAGSLIGRSHGLSLV